MSSAFSICLRRGRGLVDGQRLVGVDVELDLGHLHVERQVDQHRARAARAHQVKGLLEGARHLRRLAHGDAPLGDRLGDGFDVHGLEVFLVQPRARRLAGDAQDGDAVGLAEYRPVIMSVPAGPLVPMHTPMLPALARV
jgi:hypothetical protein